MKLSGIAFRYLKGQKKHTVMTIIAVILSTAFMTTLLSAVSIYRACALNVARETYGTYHVLFNGLDKQSLVAIRSMDIFSETENYSVSAYTSAVDIDFGQMDNENATMEYLMVGGYVVDDTFLRIHSDSLTMMPENVTAVTEGRLPEKDGEIVISSAYYTLWGSPELGDTVEAGLITCGAKTDNAPSEEIAQMLPYLDESLTENFDIKAIETVSFTVVGFSEVYNIVDYSDTRLRSYSYLSDNLLARFSDDTNSLYWDMDKAFRNVGMEIDDFDYSLNQSLLDSEGKGTDAKYSQALFFGVVYLFVIFIMFCIRLVIDNSFEISSKERIKQFGLLKAAGASKKQVFALTLWEAVYLAVPGVAAGLLLGAIVSRILFNVISGLDFLADYSLGGMLVYDVRPYVYISSAVIGVVWVCISAVATGLRSINASPVEAMRNAGRQDIVRIPRRPSKIGSGQSFISAYSSVSIKRNRKRYIITMLSMVLSITLFTGFSYAVDIAAENVTNSFDVLRQPFDYVVYHGSLSASGAPAAADAMVESGLFDTVQYDTYISLFGSTENMGLPADSPLNEQGSISVNIHPINRDTYEKLIVSDVSYEELDSSRKLLICADMYDPDNNYELIYRAYTTPPDALTGSPFIPADLSFLDEMTIECGGLYTTECRTYQSANISVAAIVSEDTYAAMMENNQRDAMTELSDGMEGYNIYYRNILANAAEGMETEAENWLDRHFYNSYQNNRSERIAALSLLEAIKVLGYFVIGIIGLIAAVNIANIISANVLNRTKELAMLRACGMSNKQLRALILRESMLYAAIAGVFSLILTELIIGGIQVPFLLHINDLSFDDLSFRLSFTKPLPYIIIAAAAAFIVAAAASLAPASRIVSEPIVENIDGGE